MNRSDLDLVAALSLYNKHYDNSSYLAISRELAEFLEIDPDYSMITNAFEASHNQFMNMLIDACLEVCGCRRYRNASVCAIVSSQLVSGRFENRVRDFLDSFVDRGPDA